MKGSAQITSPRRRPDFAGLMQTGAVLGLLAFAANAQAQVADHLVDEARRLPLNGRIPTVLYSVEQRGTWTLTAVYAQPLAPSGFYVPDEPVYWMARRTTGEGAIPAGHVAWVDSRSCPALEGAIWWMSRLTIPSVNVAGLTPRQPAEGGQPMIVPTHAPNYTIWGMGNQPDNGPAFVSMSSITGMIADWGQTTERNLRDCWTPDEPPPG